MASYGDYFGNNKIINNSLEKGKLKAVLNLKKYVKINITSLVILAFIALIVFIIIYIVRNRKKLRSTKKIKPDLELYKIDTNFRQEPIKNLDLECPPDLSKYTFMFNIILNDFYVDTGYWKAIMLKGNEVNYNTSKCGVILVKENEECLNNYDNIVDDELNEYIKSSTKNPIDVEKNLGKRLQIICKAIDVDNQNEDKSGSNQLCYAISNCKKNIFTEKGENVNLTSGQCLNFINEHKTYCDNVFKTKNKVSRDSKLITSKEKYYDDYDNICSQDNLLNKHPELLPKNLDSLKSMKLINSAKKMDISNGEDKIDKSFEGCYNFEEMEKSELLKKIGTYDKVTDDILQECNNEALNSSNYFGIKDNDCYSINLEKEEQLSLKKQLNNKECGKDYRTPKNNDNIFISRALKPEENILLKCWENIASIYPTQNPGIWLHPYKNDLRIMVTTINNDSKTDYENYVNEMIHPFKETNFRNLRNYNIIPVNKNDINEHAFYSDSQEHNKCTQNKNNTEETYYYKEYFDVTNIPIKKQFNLAVVINEKSVEIYIDGVLVTTQFLFGTAYFNSGDLHISPGKKENGEDLKLNSIITDFKYFNKPLQSKDIKNVILSKPVEVKNDNQNNIQIENKEK
uniref:Uncharacterized protein n=1 Tax=Mimiviridae sp. ChoanoV1 TaxID=2596887 RepID=A0A5B8HUU8_9VIRU|nr:hypothetical protein 1_74 [Mimiviridae sp. ChoanoV1]